MSDVRVGDVRVGGGAVLQEAPRPSTGRPGGWRHVLLVASSRSPLAWLLIGFVRLWRAVISPLYGDVCKFHPTCSSYGLTALEVHGALKGSWLIVRRLVRCHPWSLGGHDPVPGAGEHPHSMQGDRLS